MSAHAHAKAGHGHPHGHGHGHGKRKKWAKRTGFTLLELMIVLAILAILASLVFGALNPSKQIGAARDGERLHYVRTLHAAFLQALVDSVAFPEVLALAEGGVAEVCADEDLPDCADLSALVPTYIAEMPIDALAQEGKTGFCIEKVGSLTKFFSMYYALGPSDDVSELTCEIVQAGGGGGDGGDGGGGGDAPPPPPAGGEEESSSSEESPPEEGSSSSEDPLPECGGEFLDDLTNAQFVEETETLPTYEEIGGIWNTVIDAQAHGGSYRVGVRSEEQNAAPKAYWYPQINIASTANLFVRWNADPGYATDVKYSVVINGVSACSVAINQTVDPSGVTDGNGLTWLWLGSFEVTGNVQVSAAVDGVPLEEGLASDALMFKVE